MEKGSDVPQNSIFPPIKEFFKKCDNTCREPKSEKGEEIQ